jgi:hypothetical protein
MIKKILALLLAVCFILSMPACKNGNGDGDSDETLGGSDATEDLGATETPFEPMLLVGEGAPTYFVVVSRYAEDGVKELADEFCDSLKACGMSARNSTDFKDAEDYEIIINETNRKFDYDLGKDVGEYGYYIVSKGKRIFIGANSDERLELAMSVLLEKLFGYVDGAENYTPSDKVTLESALEIVHTQKTLLENISFAGNSIYDYTINCQKSFGTAAQRISTMVKKTLGISIPMDDEGKRLSISIEEHDGKNATLEILDNGNVVIKAATDREAIRAFALFFNQRLRGAEQTSLDLPKGKYIDEDVSGFVLYSEFGAIGDGVSEDIGAILAAHNYANTNGLPVKVDENAVYYISKIYQTVTIQTDTDWRGARFIIDDSGLRESSPDINLNVFKVATSAKAPSVDLSSLTSIEAGCSNIGVAPGVPMLLILRDANVKQYIREGANANNGTAKSDIILVDADGNVDPNAPIMWDYDQFTEKKIIAVDSEPLYITGGHFTTISNRIDTKGVLYCNRGISINRSGVVVDGLEHYVEGESKNAASYHGFINVDTCANVTVKNCVFTGRMQVTYAGTYDIGASNTVNLKFENCIQHNDILDTSCWGIMGTNFCKNITLEGCSFSRFDAHQGVYNVTIKDSSLGHQCLNAIGMGTLLIEDTTLYGGYLIVLRDDYGSTWKGDVIIRNCTWVPSQGNMLGSSCSMIYGKFSGYHEFGYDCYMPENIYIDGLTVDDKNCGENYRGVYLFHNITPARVDEAYEEEIEKNGYPYYVTKNVFIKGFETTSGKGYSVSPNEFMFRDVNVVENGEN